MLSIVALHGEASMFFALRGPQVNAQAFRATT
jgi:hypothetical protein